MQTVSLSQSFTYDGSQLRSLFAYTQTGVKGNCVVSWRGPCDVHRDLMVDMEDWRQESKIQSPDMLHFIIEAFNTPLTTAVGYQRLFVGLIKDLICDILLTKLKNKILPSHLLAFYEKLKRQGDDLYFEDKKINVSIATVSPVSSLIHIGINICHEGTPVPTMGLKDFQIDTVFFGEKIMDLWSREYVSIAHATCKVKGVP